MVTKDEMKVRDLVNGPIIIMDCVAHSMVEELEYYGNDICSRCSLEDECKQYKENNPFETYCKIYSANGTARFEKGRISLLAPLSALLWLQDCAYEEMKEINMVYPYNINKQQK